MNDAGNADMTAADFVAHKRFEVMLREIFGGDAAFCKQVIEQAMMLAEDFQADSPFDAYPALSSSFFSFMLLSASIPDLDSNKLQEFILDHFKLMRPVAQWMAEQQREMLFNPASNDPTVN